MGLSPTIGKAKASHHFVKDQDNSVFVRFIPQRLQKTGLGRNDTLQRFYDNGCNIGSIFGKNRFNIVEVVERRDYHFRCDAVGNTGLSGIGCGKLACCAGARLI